jgi:hypothetical protein
VKSLSEATAAVEKSADDVIFLALGGEVKPEVVSSLGRDGAFIAESVSDLGAAFTDAATSTRALQQRIYVLGYCSPKRAGTHSLTVGVGTASGGSTGVSFDASSFGPGCSALGFETACEGKFCGGLLCGECGPGSCSGALAGEGDGEGGQGTTCECPSRFSGSRCESCSSHFSSEGCAEGAGAPP